MRHGKFYGSAVVGERGQIVIPAEAREELSIEPGEKMLVLGNRHTKMVVLMKADVMGRFADMMFRKSQFFEEMMDFGDSGTDRAAGKEGDLNEDTDGDGSGTKQK